MLEDWFDEPSDDPWTQGYRTWCKGHSAWEDGYGFDEKRFGIDTNPCPPSSPDHLEWQKGWGTALDDYIAGLYA